MSGQMYVYIKIYGTDITSYRRYLMHKSNVAGFTLFKCVYSRVSVVSLCHHSPFLILLPQRENILKFRGSTNVCFCSHSLMNYAF